MKAENHNKGSLGESIASEYLSNNGFKILAKNWRTRFGEIDIIACKASTLHFVEVKLKIGETYGSPEEMINKRKITQVTRTAEMFLLSNHNLAKKYKSNQIGALCIVISKNQEIKRLDYYANITI